VEAGEALGGWNAWIHRVGDGTDDKHDDPQGRDLAPDCDVDTGVGKRQSSEEPDGKRSTGIGDDATERDGHEKSSALGTFIVWEVAGAGDFHS
jgi:hypothetical protein